MTALELLVILVLAGAIVILMYFYMQDARNLSFSNVRSVAVETSEKARTTVSSAGGKVKGEGNSIGVSEKMSAMGEKASGFGDKVRLTISGTGDKDKDEGNMMGGVSEKVSGVGEKLKGTVKGVPKSTDNISNRIDIFLNDKSDQLIKDWELATKDDILDIEKRYTKVSRDLDTLDSRFYEYRGSTNKKLKQIEERLNKLESVDE